MSSDFKQYLLTPFQRGYPWLDLVEQIALLFRRPADYYTSFVLARRHTLDQSHRTDASFIYVLLLILIISELIYQYSIAFNFLRLVLFPSVLLLIFVGISAALAFILSRQNLRSRSKKRFMITFDLVVDFMVIFLVYFFLGNGVFHPFLAKSRLLASGLFCIGLFHASYCFVQGISTLSLDIGGRNVASLPVIAILAGLTLYILGFNPNSFVYNLFKNL